jgi:hypothetical protein
MTGIDATRPRAGSATRLDATGGAGAAATRPAGVAFRVEEEAATGEAEAAGPLAGVSSVLLGVMLAAEALDREPPHDQAARRKGHAVLSGLTALQRALLEDGDPAAVLERLTSLIADMPVATEPRLAALVSAIVLRARVELALLERSDASAV